jgi:serine/threonine protein kinase
LPHDTRKSDVWSLGVTFFEILIGRTPFELSDAEQFTTKEELEKYWTRTVSLFLFLKNFETLTVIFGTAPWEVGRKLEDVQRDGEVIAKDDCSKRRPAVHSVRCHG